MASAGAKEHAERQPSQLWSLQDPLATASQSDHIEPRSWDEAKELVEVLPIIPELLSLRAVTKDSCIL